LTIGDAMKKREGRNGWKLLLNEVEIKEISKFQVENRRGE